MAFNSPPTLYYIILSCVCFPTVFAKDVNDLIVFYDYKVFAGLRCTQIYNEGKYFIIVLKLYLSLTLS